MLLCLWYTVVFEWCHFFHTYFPWFCVFDPHQVNAKPLTHLLAVSSGFQITTVYCLGSVSYGVFLVAWHFIVGSSKNKEYSLQRNLNVDHLSDFCLQALPCHNLAEANHKIVFCLILLLLRIFFLNLQDLFTCMSWGVSKAPEKRSVPHTKGFRLDNPW